jgi:transcriptional regulator with XRE-family HTH domain
MYQTIDCNYNKHIMDSQNIFFNSNIKFLRERMKMSQETLAAKVHLTRTKLNALENGHTKAPQPVDYLNYSNFFKISIDSLLRVDLSKLSELKLRELEAGNDVYLTGGKIRVLAITVDSENKENIEYVPVKAKAGYRAGYSDPEYLAALPKFSLPNLPEGTFRMFPITGDSMLPLPDGADVICQFVQDWTAIKPGTLCIVILRGEQEFVFKKVTVDASTGILILESLNPAYQPYQVGLDQVLEIWKYQSYQSSVVPEAPAEVQHISATLNEVLKRLTLIEGKVQG